MTDNPQFDAVKEFNTTFGHAVRDVPSLDHDDIHMRMSVVFLEEVDEICEAYYNYKNGSWDKITALTEMADALADTLVTLYGLAQATGIPITEAFDIAHASNMSKLDENGEAIYYPEGHPKVGKIAKGPNFWDPKDKFRELIESRLND